MGHDAEEFLLKLVPTEKIGFYLKKDKHVTHHLNTYIYPLKDEYRFPKDLFEDIRYDRIINRPKFFFVTMSLLTNTQTKKVIYPRKLPFTYEYNGGIYILHDVICHVGSFHYVCYSLRNDDDTYIRYDDIHKMYVNKKDVLKHMRRSNSVPYLFSFNVTSLCLLKILNIST